MSEGSVLWVDVDVDDAGDVVDEVTVLDELDEEELPTVEDVTELPPVVEELIVLLVLLDSTGVELLLLLVEDPGLDVDDAPSDVELPEDDELALELDDDVALELDVTEEVLELDPFVSAAEEEEDEVAWVEPDDEELEADELEEDELEEGLSRFTLLLGPTKQSSCFIEHSGSSSNL